MRPLVAIIGRPNVGKSTLLNRLANRRIAVVENKPGVTRDRLSAECELGGRNILVVDTGGFDLDAKDELAKQALWHAQQAVEDADAILFLCDARDGLRPLDQAVARVLRKSGKSILCLANKCDPGSKYCNELEFYALGLDLLPISAEHGTGLGEVADWVSKHVFPSKESEHNEADKEGRVRVCFLGRPNVGKSLLTNRLVGIERQIVSAIPGTTRDVVHIMLDVNGRRFLLVDTPGVRRRRSIGERVEHYSVFAALRSIERVDVGVVVLDGSEPFADQDARLLGLVNERGRGLVIAVNKSDLWQRDASQSYMNELKYKTRFVSYAPVVTISAKTGFGLTNLLSAVTKTYTSAGYRFSTAQLNRFMHEVIEKHPPPVIKGRQTKIFYITQTNIRPPTFVVWVNNAQHLSPSYRRYVENQLRGQFPYKGTPLHWYYRTRSAQSNQR